MMRPINTPNSIKFWNSFELFRGKADAIIMTPKDNWLINVQNEYVNNYYANLTIQGMSIRKIAKIGGEFAKILGTNEQYQVLIHRNKQWKNKGNEW